MEILRGFFMAEEFELYNPEENISKSRRSGGEAPKPQEAGRDPFRISRFDRTHYSSDIINNFEALRTVRQPSAGS